MTNECLVIETEALTKHFRRHEAVNDLSLSVPKGAIYALIGANGAGKTTTLRMLVNLLVPDGGRARVLGIDSRELSHRDYLRIGYLSENQKLPDRLTVGQYFSYMRSLYPNWDRDLERSLQKQFALPPDRAVGKLSHGMRMKTMLVSVLSFRPELLILDEPLSGLDPLVRDEVMEGLLRQAEDTTIVISSHELSEIEACTSHIAFMHSGRIVIQEPIETVTSRFREITVTVAAEARVPAQLPRSWLSPELSDQVFRCIETEYVCDPDITQKLNEHLGSAHHIDVRSMSLREISKALMRATRSETKS